MSLYQQPWSPHHNTPKNSLDGCYTVEADPGPFFGTFLLVLWHQTEVRSDDIWRAFSVIQRTVLEPAFGDWA